MLLTASDIWERGPSSSGYSPDTIPKDYRTKFKIKNNNIPIVICKR